MNFFSEMRIIGNVATYPQNNLNKKKKNGKDTGFGPLHSRIWWVQAV